jgi:hypothetical protein
MPDLERVPQQLHDSEINAGVQTFYEAGMRVWIGDELNGKFIVCDVHPTGVGLTASPATNFLDIW